MLEVSSLLLRAILMLLRVSPGNAGTTSKSRRNEAKIRRVVEHIDSHIADGPFDCRARANRGAE
jgi:hypothetical protein